MYDSRLDKPVAAQPEKVKPLFGKDALAAYDEAMFEEKKMVDP